MSVINPEPNPEWARDIVPSPGSFYSLYSNSSETSPEPYSLPSLGFHIETDSNVVASTPKRTTQEIRPYSGVDQAWLDALPSPVTPSTVEPAQYQMVTFMLRAGDIAAERRRLFTREAEPSNETNFLRRQRKRAKRLAHKAREQVFRVYEKLGWVAVQANRLVPSVTLGTAIHAITDRPKMRALFVGDSMSGKTNIINRFAYGSFTVKHQDTRPYFVRSTYDVPGYNFTVDIEIWDTPGDAGYLETLNYLAWDVVFLCMDVNNYESYVRIHEHWIHAIREHCRNVPVILVGAKTDLRVGPMCWAPMYNNGLDTIIPHEWGHQTYLKLHLDGYVECSALNRKGIHDVFEAGVNAVLRRRFLVEKELFKKSKYRLAYLKERLQCLF
ncbi:P-loop containing nucleoside triphosphate hydrolase protein [Xylariaceae sp. FL0255]|nr:P-loop containing nucleoside triphosphate hydrolase protein [Xylariaceae sp. FL0255]